MLKLNQTDFGRKLGVSRSVILNIELEKVPPKDIMIDHIREVFNVNEDWLINGVGDVFIDVNLNKNEKLIKVNKLFNDLSPEYQDYFLQQLEALITVKNKSVDNIKRQID